MITIRPSAERGTFDHGWLQSAHTFSFADYHDPRHMGYRRLRVINEDHVAAGQGFGMHPHRDMEIVTWILDGALEHKDSMGNGSVIRPGDAQRMSAGTGVLHSEFNPSKTDSTHLLQIWLFPSERGIQPGYEEKHFPRSSRLNKLAPMATPDGRDGSVVIHTDAAIYATILEKGQSVKHRLASGRGAWLQVARGEVTLNGQRLKAGDGASVEDERDLAIAALADSEFLLFDLG